MSSFYLFEPALKRRTEGDEFTHANLTACVPTIQTSRIMFSLSVRQIRDPVSKWAGGATSRGDAPIAHRECHQRKKKGDPQRDLPLL
jgi:hypothetical protein